MRAAAKYIQRTGRHIGLLAFVVYAHIRRVRVHALLGLRSLDLLEHFAPALAGGCKEFKPPLTVALLDLASLENCDGRPSRRSRTVSPCGPPKTPVSLSCLHRKRNKGKQTQGKREAEKQTQRNEQKIRQNWKDRENQTKDVRPRGNGSRLRGGRKQRSRLNKRKQRSRQW